MTSATSHANPTFRIGYRRSILCASFLTSVRSLASTKSTPAIAENLARFRNQTLNGSRPALAERLKSVEDSLLTPDDPTHFVIGSTQVEGVRAINRFFHILQSVGEELWRDGNHDLQLPTLESDGSALKNAIDHLFRYSVADQMFLGTSALVIAPFVQLMLGADLTTLLHEAVAVPVLAGLGVDDMPVRYLRSYNFGLLKVLNMRKEFSLRRQPWMYFSKDVRVTRRFVDELISELEIDWKTLDEQNKYEDAAGLFRLKYWRHREQHGFDPVDFKIDVLVERNGAKSTMTVVLRASGA